MNDMQIAFASHTWSKETPVECYSVTCNFESRVDVLDGELMSCDLSCKLLAACVCRVCAYPSILVSEEYVFEMGLVFLRTGSTDDPGAKVQNDSVACFHVASPIRRTMRAHGGARHNELRLQKALKRTKRFTI